MSAAKSNRPSPSRPVPVADGPVRVARANEVARPVDTLRRRYAVCAALFFVTVLLFARAVGNGFVNYDDPDYVTANEHVRAGLTADGVRWAFSRSEVSYWHPLTWLSHMLDWQLYGNNPAGHHATSVGLHAVNAVLAFLALRRLTGAFWLSAAAVAVFAWHPLRVESVAWIAERKDVLSGGFGLLALWAYAGYAEKRRAGKFAVADYALVGVAFAGGLMSKPMLVTLPGILLLLDCWPLRRGTLSSSPTEWAWLFIEKIPFLLMSVVVSLVTVKAQVEVGTLSTVLPLGARLGNALVAVVRYLGKFFVPVNLAVLYPHPGFWPAANVALAALFLAAVTAVAIGQRTRRPWVLVGWLWFLGALVPAIGIVQVGIQAMADRYTYLPMLGVEVALLWTLREAVGPWGSRRAWAIALTAVLVGLAARTVHQIGYWKNSFTLFDHTIAVTDRTKNNYLAYNNRGTWLLDAGRVDEAIADYRHSLAIKADYEEASNNLGHALQQQGRAREAVEYIRAALKTKPDLLEAHNNLGNALSDLGQLDEAFAEYEYVLARRPNHADALNNYGVALAMKGKLPEAQARIEASLRIVPDKASAHSNLGNVLAMMGRRDDAIAHYRRSLELSPDEAQTHNNLAMALVEAGQLADGIAHYERALALAPVNPEAHANLGAALAKAGRRDEAMAHLRTALQQKPDFAPAKAWLDALTAPPPAPAK